jgi:hypothetical protein
MFRLVRNWSQRIWLALIWSISTQILLSLPGAVFPSGGLFNIPNLDKIVHLGLFGGLVFVWCLYVYYRADPPTISTKTIWTLVLAAFVYGVIMEFVQKNFIPNRSFDGGDIIADLAGSLIGYFVTQWFFAWTGRRKVYKKN